MSNPESEQLYADAGESGVKRYRAEATRSPRRPPLVNIAILIGIIGLSVVLIYQFLFTRPPELAGNTLELPELLAHVEELSTVQSDLRIPFLVYDRPEGFVVRSLSSVEGDLDAEGPTLIVELHAIAEVGVRLNESEGHVRIDDETMYVSLSEAQVLNLRIAHEDTRIIATLRNSKDAAGKKFLSAVAQKGDSVARSIMRADSNLSARATRRAREALRFIAEQSGRTAEFTE